MRLMCGEVAERKKCDIMEKMHEESRGEKGRYG